MLQHTLSIAAKPSRVVVIGAGGFVGSAITRCLRADSVDILPLTRRELDLLAEGAAAKLAGLLRPTDSVVMVSAVAPTKTIEQLMINMRLVEPVCAALAASPPAHLLYISSDAVYADDANPVIERSSLAPSTLHGMMHAAREIILRSATATPFAALRPTLIYGEHDPHNGYGPNRFRRQAMAGESILIFGEGEERRDHIWIEDVARLAALMLGRRSRGALNAVTGRAVSFNCIASEIASHFPGSRVSSQARPGLRPHLLHRHFSITEQIRAFPEFHVTTLTDGLRAMCTRPS